MTPMSRCVSRSSMPAAIRMARSGRKPATRAPSPKTRLRVTSTRSGTSSCKGPCSTSTPSSSETSTPISVVSWRAEAYRRRSGGAALDDPAQEGLAGSNLLQGDELVGLVRLGDIAGAAEDGRDSRGLEEPRFRAIGDDTGAVLAGHRKRQDLGR